MDAPEGSLFGTNTLPTNSLFEPDDSAIQRYMEPLNLNGAAALVHEYTHTHTHWTRRQSNPWRLGWASEASFCLHSESTVHTVHTYIPTYSSMSMHAQVPLPATGVEPKSHDVDPFVLPWYRYSTGIVHRLPCAFLQHNNTVT